MNKNKEHVAGACLEDHSELGVSVGYVRGLCHECRHHVAKLQQRLVDVLRLYKSEARSTRLVDALAA